MASTLFPQRAYDYVKHFIKDMRLDPVAWQICDDVQKMMWMYAPWRWTLGTFTPITLIGGTQDYNIGSFPSDFLHLYDAYTSDGSVAPRDLRVEPVLSPTVMKTGQADRAAVTGSILRISPVPAAFSGTGPSVICRYKKQAPNVTASNIASTGLAFDDEWFWVFQEGVLWKAYQYADDQRAGGATVAAGKVQYTGQLANFMAALDYMATKEILPDPPKQKRDAQE